MYNIIGTRLISGMQYNQRQFYWLLIIFTKELTTIIDIVGRLSTLRYFEQVQLIIHKCIIFYRENIEFLKIPRHFIEFLIQLGAMYWIRIDVILNNTKFKNVSQKMFNHYCDFYVYYCNKNRIYECYKNTAFVFYILNLSYFLNQLLQYIN